jgi:hypothetical protein
MELECYPTEPEWLPRIVPGRPQRAWMDSFADRHAYRCLPLTMANTTGWEILCPGGFSATWNGGPRSDDITLKGDPGFGGLDRFVRSHFTRGIITLHPGYLFRTPPGWSMWTTGAPNHIKDGIQALTGLVETDWLPFPFTMNWMFTRPGTIRFEKGEPFCFITVAQDKALAEVDFVQRKLEDNPDLNGQYEAWFAQRDAFNQKIADRDPAALKEAWQRFYFKGEIPDDAGPQPTDHVNKRRLKSPRKV